MRSMYVVIWVVVLMSACGGGDDGSISLDEFSSKFARATCEHTFRCCDATEIMDQFDGIDPPPTSVDECVSTYGVFIQLGVLFWRDGIDTGRIQYDSEAAADCLAAFEVIGCTLAPEEDPPACDRFIIGKVAAGDTCEGDEECAAPDSFCDTDSEGPSTCKALPTVGMPCDFDCASGAYCDSTDQCAALKADGAACVFDSECQSHNCDSASSQCATRTTCNGA
jgi:hypothetical protein